MEVLQRYAWSGKADRLGDCFRLKKGPHVAECQLWSHVLGWELRLEGAGEFMRTQVCRSEEEVFATFEAWRAAMVEKGWAS